MEHREDLLPVAVEGFLVEDVPVFLPVFQALERLAGLLLLLGVAGAGDDLVNTAHQALLVDLLAQAAEPAKSALDLVSESHRDRDAPEIRLPSIQICDALKLQLLLGLRIGEVLFEDHVTLTRVSLDLLTPLHPMKKGVRLLGISLSSLRSEKVDMPPQMTLEVSFLLRGVGASTLFVLATH